MAGREAEIMSGLACVQEWAGPARTHSFVFHRASFDAVAPGRWGAAVIGEATALAEARKSPCPYSGLATGQRSEEHTSELQSLMRNTYACFCLKKKKTAITHINE